MLYKNINNLIIRYNSSINKIGLAKVNDITNKINPNISCITRKQVKYLIENKKNFYCFPFIGYIDYKIGSNKLWMIDFEKNIWRVENNECKTFYNEINFYGGEKIKLIYLPNIYITNNETSQLDYKLKYFNVEEVI